MLLLQLLLTLSWVVTLISAEAPVFQVHPVSINTTEGSVVEFTCVANNNPTSLVFLVDGSAAGVDPNKGFIEQAAVSIGSNTISRTLLVTASVADNDNSMIRCQAINADLMGANSDTAILRVQGPLSSVVDLSYSFIDSSTVNISWSPPFTLPGTDITGYNISATSNGTTTNRYFISNSYYELSLTDITDSPCNAEIIITVSGYNGLDGENTTLTIEPQNVQAIPVTLISLLVQNSTLIQEFEFFTIKFGINVSSICYGQYPTHINLTIQYSNNGSLLTTIDNIPLVSTKDTDELLFVEISVQLPVDSNLTATASYNDFEAIQSIITFRTPTTLIVEFTDTIGPSVKFACDFRYADSDVIGCRLELTLSTNNTNSVPHIGTGNRTDDNDKVNGTINGVNTAGEYNVSVYKIEKNESMFPIILDTVSISLLNSTMPLNTTTTTRTSTSTMTSPTTSTIPPSTTPTHGISATIIIVIVVIVAVVVVAVIVFVCCVVCYRKGKESNNTDKIDMSSDILPEKNLASDKSSTVVSESSSVQSVLPAHGDTDYLELGQPEESSNKNEGAFVASGAATDRDTTTTTTSSEEDSTLLPPPQKHSVNAQDQQSKVCTYADLDSVREQPPPRPRQTEKEVIYWDVKPTPLSSSLPPQIPPKKKNTQTMSLQIDESTTL